MLESSNRIMIAKKGAKRLRGGHPWAFRGEIVSSPPGITPGTPVEAVDERNYLIGIGFFNPKTLISFRLISPQNIPLDRSFWSQRLERARQLRELVVPAEDSAARLVYAEADGIPGLVVDRYGDVLVVQMLTAGIEREATMWIELLQEAFHPRGILARNDQKSRELEGLPREKRLLWGDVPRELIVTEGGCQFIVDPWEGQKTGAFLDQRENRTAAATYAKGRVLDAFCYQGWFGIQCAPRSTEVVALDGSEPALEMVRRNADLNGLTNVTTLHTNVFDYLYTAAKGEELFDVVMLDPPAFAKSRRAITSGIKGYKEINLRAMRLLPPGGILITSSCSYHLSEAEFLGVIEEAARDGGRQVQILEKRTQGRDHPILLTHPESYYLKCFILRVL